MAGTFTFNGAHASIKYIKAIRTQRPLIPSRKHQFVEIPFKSGSYLIPDDSASDIVIPVTCLLDTKNQSIFEIGRLWLSWLNTTNWAKLIFDDDPNYSYDAICVSGVTIEELKNPEVTLEFRCKPVMMTVTV